MIDRCLLWFDEFKNPVISNFSSIFSIWPKEWDFFRTKGLYGPQLMTCDIPEELRLFIPKAISLIDYDLGFGCYHLELTNNLRINYDSNNNIKEEFGACVQALRYSTVDYSIRLIEWLELLKILGVHKVYFYKFSVHNNMEKVLDYYIRQVLDLF